MKNETLQKTSICLVIPLDKMFKAQLLNGASHTQHLFSEVVNIYAKLKLYILKFCSRDSSLLALYQSTKEIISVRKNLQSKRHEKTRGGFIPLNFFLSNSGREINAQE